MGAQPQAGLEDNAPGVAPLPIATPIQADHRLGSLLEEISEPTQGGANRHSKYGVVGGHNLREVASELLLPLASILDEFSRYCVGWALSRFIDTRLTLSALEMALAARQPEMGLIHHSDQGVQYASSEYVLRLEEAGARISMAAVGNPTRMPSPRASFGP
jgi:transposase InsO family protein